MHRLARGLPHPRPMPEIMTEVYWPFDRRCRPETVLKKFGRLTGRVRRFKELGKSLTRLRSPTREKALVFLDDRLLGAPSKAGGWAVPWGTEKRLQRQDNGHVEERLALDTQREQRAANAGRPSRHSIVYAPRPGQYTNLATLPKTNSQIAARV